MFLVVSSINHHFLSASGLMLLILSDFLTSARTTLSDYESQHTANVTSLKERYSALTALKNSLKKDLEEVKSAKELERIQQDAVIERLQKENEDLKNAVKKRQEENEELEEAMNDLKAHFADVVDQSLRRKRACFKNFRDLNRELDG